MGQHTVPQRHLVNFQDPAHPGFIWLHDKRGISARLVSIEKAVQQKGFYSAETEQFLAREVELPANKVIDRLTSGSAIDSDERLQLARYVGVVFMRVPFHRRWALTLVPHALSLVVNNLRSQILAIASEGGVSPELIARRLREIDEAEEKFNREIPAEALAQVNSPLPSKVITSTLVAMTWRLVESTGPQFFITTDNPCFFFRSEGFGLGNDQSEFCLLLSTNYALHGCWQSSRSDLVHARVDQRTVREINRRLVSQTDRVAFYHKPAPWLFKILLKEELFLSRIEWGGQ